MLDYAVAPDGSSLVVADGRRLVFLRADGIGSPRPDRAAGTSSSIRRTRPTASASRSLAPTPRPGAGLGLWEWEVGGGDADRDRPARGRSAPARRRRAGASDGGDRHCARRATRRTAQALAFVDLAGSVGILELPAERADASSRSPPPPRRSGCSDSIRRAPDRLCRSRRRPEPDLRRAGRRRSRAARRTRSTGCHGRIAVVAERPRSAPGRRRVGVGADGRIAYADRAGALADRRQPDEAPVGAGARPSGRSSAAAFAPGRAGRGRRRGRRRQEGSASSVVDLDDGSDDPARAGRRRAHVGCPDRPPRAVLEFAAPSLAGYVTVSSRRRFVCVNPRP